MRKHYQVGKREHLGRSRQVKHYQVEKNENRKNFFSSRKHYQVGKREHLGLHRQVKHYQVGLRIMGEKLFNGHS